MIMKYPLTFIAEVLATADEVGCPEAGRRHGLTDKTVYAWFYKRMREAPDWLSPENQATDAAYRARTDTARRKHAAANNRNRMALAARKGQPLFVPVLGSQRRVQGLLAIGWTLRDIGDEIGVSLSRVWHIATAKNPTVHPDTALAVRDVYRRLLLRTPDHHPAWLLGRNRRNAARAGYMSPFAWDDADLDDPAARPNPAWIRKDTAA